MRWRPQRRGRSFQVVRPRLGHPLGPLFAGGGAAHPAAAVPALAVLAVQLLDVVVALGAGAVVDGDGAAAQPRLLPGDPDAARPGGVAPRRPPRTRTPVAVLVTLRVPLKSQFCGQNKISACQRNRTAGAETKPQNLTYKRPRFFLRRENTAICVLTCTSQNTCPAQLGKHGKMQPLSPGAKFPSTVTNSIISW